MNWSKWLLKFGVAGGTLIITGLAMLLAVLITALVQFILGNGFTIAPYISSLVAAILLVGPLAYVITVQFYQLDEADLDMTRKEAQVAYLMKQASQNGGSEKDQLIRDLNSFAQTVAHDLKTPLTTILGFASMLSDHQAVIPPTQQKEALQTIVKTSLKMNNIIQELLLLAAVRQSDVRTGPIQMASIVSAAKQRLLGVVSEANAEIIVPDAATWPKALGYAPWIEEVWINYLSNALKYGGTPPRIELGADADYAKTPTGRRLARFWVKDNGKGIAPEDQAQLFSQFTRLDQVKAEGHGLGLSIVSRVIEKLGGQVGVESKPGEGSLFYFTLPMAVIEPSTRVRPENVWKRK